MSFPHLNAVATKHMASVYASFFFVACVALLVGFLRNLCRAAARFHPRHASPKAAAAMFRSACQARWSSGSVVDPEVEEQVWKTMCSRQAQLARVVVPVVCIVGSRRAFGAASNLWTGQPSGRSAAQDAAFVALFTTTALCTLMPRMLRVDRLLLWHTFFMIAVHIITSPFTLIAPAHVSLFQTKAFGATLAVSLVCMRFPVLLVTQSLHSIGVVAGLIMAVPRDAGLDIDEMIAVELSTCFFKLAIFRFVAKLVDQTVRGEVAASVGACQRSAVSSLLGMMCDAVVELDQDLAMKEHVGKMAGMLMHGSGTTLKGRQLADFLGSDEDRLRFEEAIARCAADGDGALAPSMINVSLRDSIGNLISSVLHHVPYRSVAGRIHHLVGVREDVDARCEAPAASAPELQALPAPGRALPAAVLTEAVLRGVRRRRRHCGGPRTVSSGGSVGSSTSTDDADQVVAEVFACDVLPMNRASEAFISAFCITGDPVGRSFRALLPEETGNSFVEWVCEHATKVASGESEAFTAVFGSVEIVTAPPGGRPWRLEACFPRPHRELQRRNMYLVGIRLSASDRREASSPVQWEAATGSVHALPGGRGAAVLSMSL